MTSDTAAAPKIRWALAGYGSGGRVFHAPLITSAAGLDLVAVVTASPQRQSQVAQNLPGVQTVANLAALAELGVEGVTITTPSATHADLAHQAIDLGLAVVVDKPFALSQESAAELVAHAAAAGTVLTVYQNRRWDSDFLTVRKLIDTGMLGTVHRYTSRIERFKPVKSGWSGGSIDVGAGALLDLGPHLIDQALHLFGPVRSVHADLLTVREESGAEDDFELHLEHVCGVRSTVAAGMSSAATGPRFLVNGSTGGYLVTGFDVQEEQLKAGGSPQALGERWGVEPESAYGTVFTADGSAVHPSERGRWDTYYPAVARAVLGLGAVPVDPADAVATAQVIDAARVSAAARTVVEFPIH